jgi:hypothetical protein
MVCPSDATSVLYTSDFEGVKIQNQGRGITDNVVSAVCKLEHFNKDTSESKSSGIHQRKVGPPMRCGVES